MQVEFPNKEQHLILDGPAGNLEVVAAPPKGEAKDKTIIICHPHPLHSGTMNNKVVTTLFRSFCQWGFHGVRFNFRGVGQSGGNYGETVGETEDLMAIIHWVQQQKPQQPLWLAGFSFGSFVAAKGAARCDCEQLISVAPPVHHFDFDEVPALSCPWLVIQPEEDEVVPPSAVYAWVEGSSQEVDLIRVPESSHFFHGQLITLRETLLETLSHKL